VGTNVNLSPYDRVELTFVAGGRRPSPLPRSLGRLADLRAGTMGGDA
jgi:hypothetical protein